RRVRALLDVGCRCPQPRRRSDGPFLPHGGSAQGPFARGGREYALPDTAGPGSLVGAGGVPRGLLLGIRPCGEPADLPGAVGERGGHPAGGGRPVPPPFTPRGRAVLPRASPGGDDLPARRPRGRREE